MDAVAVRETLFRIRWKGRSSVRLGELEGRKQLRLGDLHSTRAFVIAATR